MKIVNISKNKIKLLLTQPISKVRVTDYNGNHIKKPSTEGKNERTNYVEWMITNAEIEELVKNYLNKKNRELLKKKLERINKYLKGSKFATRKAHKEKLDKIFMGFEIYKYEEKFYSFEKSLSSNIRIRLTFKMGDYTLAVHMFVLLPFDCDAIELINKKGKIAENDYLDSGAYAVWRPSWKDVMSIIEGLAYASEKHKIDLIGIL